MTSTPPPHSPPPPAPSPKSWERDFIAVVNEEVQNNFQTQVNATRRHQPTHLSRWDFRRDKYNGWTRLASKVLQYENAILNKIIHDYTTIAKQDKWHKVLVKRATSRFAHLEKFSLNFSSSSFVFRSNLLHPCFFGV